jgi:hypothetical protein
MPHAEIPILKTVLDLTVRLKLVSFSRLEVKTKATAPQYMINPIPSSELAIQIN